jgi:hypothetical protein
MRLVLEDYIFRRTSELLACLGFPLGTCLGFIVGFTDGGWRMFVYGCGIQLGVEWWALLLLYLSSSFECCSRWRISLMRNSWIGVGEALVVSIPGPFAAGMLGM